MEAEGNPDGENCVGRANTDWTYLGNKFGSRDGRMEGEYQGGDVVRVVEGAPTDSCRGTFRCSARWWPVGGWEWAGKQQGK